MYSKNSEQNTSDVELAYLMFIRARPDSERDFTGDLSKEIVQLPSCTVRSLRRCDRSRSRPSAPASAAWNGARTLRSPSIPFGVYSAEPSSVAVSTPRGQEVVAAAESGRGVPDQSGAGDGGHRGPRALAVDTRREDDGEQPRPTRGSNGAIECTDGSLHVGPDRCDVAGDRFRRIFRPHLSGRRATIEQER